MDSRKLELDSIAAQALGWVDERTRAIIPPIHVSSTASCPACRATTAGRAA